MVLIEFNEIFTYEHDETHTHTPSIVAFVRQMRKTSLIFSANGHKED